MGTQMLDFSGTISKTQYDVKDETGLGGGSGGDFNKLVSNKKQGNGQNQSNLQEILMVRELKRELELERKANVTREKNCRALAKKYTLEFFREKSAQIHTVV